MDVQIPLYRAKRLESDEWIEGCLLWGKYIVVSKEAFDFGSGNPECEYYEINPSTLAIHFSDMLDSEGNKIFASLSESGKGGDILLREDNVKTETLIFKDFTIQTYMYRFETWREIFIFKVAGIQK